LSADVPGVQALPVEAWFLKCADRRHRERALLPRLGWWRGGTVPTRAPYGPGTR